MEKNTKTVEVGVELGASLKRKAQAAAKDRGLTLEEFLMDTIAAKIRDHEHGSLKNFTPHGGKYLMGKSTGYELTDDGKYYPAKCWTQQFDTLFAERGAITNLVTEIVSQSQDRLIVVEKSIINTKDSLVKDLGLDPTAPWIYYGGERGYLQEKPKEENNAD